MHRGELLMNVAKFTRSTAPLVLSQLNIRPVFDVDADVQGRDLNAAAADIDKVIDRRSAAVRRRQSTSRLVAKSRPCARVMQACSPAWRWR